jgi:hypothetical protein
MEVKNPGVRGGRYYRTKSGKIRYGTEPRPKPGRSQGDGPVTLGVPGPKGPVFLPAQRRRGVIEVPEHAARQAAITSSGEATPASLEEVKAVAGVRESDPPREAARKILGIVASAWKRINAAFRPEWFRRPPMPAYNDATTPEELVQDAKAVAPTLLAVGKSVARSVGGRADAGPNDQFVVKTLSSIQSKVQRKGCPIGAINDAVRMTIYHDTPEGLARAYRRFVRTAERSGMRLVEVENKWQVPVPEDSVGYGGIHVNLAMQAPSGRTVPGEVQFHLTPFYRVKEDLHKYYEQAREGRMDANTFQQRSLMIAARGWLPYAKQIAHGLQKAWKVLYRWWR